MKTHFKVIDFFILSHCFYNVEDYILRCELGKKTNV